MRHILQLIPFLLVISSQETILAQSVSEPEKQYYVVVGTFRNQQNALAYRQSLEAKGQAVSIHSDSTSELNYVQLEKPLSKTDAAEKVLALRKTPAFRDAWMRPVSNQNNRTLSQPSLDSAKELIAAVPIASDLETQPEGPSTYQVSDTEIFLQLYNAANDKLIDGTVEIIDTERSRLIEKVKGNSYYILPDPKSTSKRITLIGNVFGYRKIQNEISYPISPTDTLNPNMEMVGTIVVLRFDMVRYAKGDINVLYNVYFFNDAAIMQPESKYELNNLLEMMQENPRMRIKLHGHSNGNASGKILLAGEDKNFFRLTNAIEGFGSAKELSFKRAEVIKDFLLASGVTPDRVELKSWGGKRPLYDKISANARRNVRVEVEILED